MSKVVNLEERVLPVKITDNETGTTYELDFARDSILFAEGRGFKIAEVGDFPVTRMPELFYYAFRKNHKNVAREKTDKLMDKMGGLSPKLVTRLLELYQQAQTSNIIQEDEDMAKNGAVTVEGLD